MDLREKIRAFVEENLIVFDNNNLSDTSDIFALGYVNSLFAMKILNYLEIHIGITISSEDMEIDNFNSIENIVAFVKKKQM